MRLHNEPMLQTALLSHRLRISNVLAGLETRGQLKNLRKKNLPGCIIRLRGRPDGANIIRGRRSTPHHPL